MQLFIRRMGSGVVNVEVEGSSKMSDLKALIEVNVPSFSDFIDLRTFLVLCALRPAFAFHLSDSCTVMLFLCGNGGNYVEISSLSRFAPVDRFGVCSGWWRAQANYGIRRETIRFVLSGSIVTDEDTVDSLGLMRESGGPLPRPFVVHKLSSQCSGSSVFLPLYLHDVLCASDRVWKACMESLLAFPALIMLVSKPDAPWSTTAAPGALCACEM